MATATRNLPEELLVEILGKLPKKDLKRARLACTLWSIAGAKWMFQRVYFAPRKASIKSFTEIAANPTFARNVKELIYDGRLFLPRLGDPESYRNAFRARMFEEFDMYGDYTRNSCGHSELEVAHEVYQGSVWNMENLGAGDKMKRVRAGDGKEFHTNVANSLVRYARLLDQQERILKQGRDFKALCKGLKSFRNISKVDALVDFDPCSDYGLRTGDQDDQEYIDCHEWYNSLSKIEFGLTVPPSVWCRRPYTQDGGEQDQDEDIKWDVRGVQRLLRAISMHCPSLKELRIASTFYKAPMTIFQLSDADVEKVRTLTTLEFHPYVTKSDDISEYAEQHHCVELLLQEAKELRILSSSKWSLNEEYEESNVTSEDLGLSERTDFGILLGKIWPHLTKLILDEGSVEVRDLMSIVRAHRGSLRGLSLEGTFLLGKEGWEHFGKEMGQILKLHSISAQGLGEESSREYCLRSFVRNMMQWALPDLLEIEEDHRKITGRLKAGSS